MCLSFSRWDIPTSQFEFIETQMVSDLRMCLECVKDCVTTVNYQNTESACLDVEHLAYVIILLDTLLK